MVAVWKFLKIICTPGDYNFVAIKQIDKYMIDIFKYPDNLDLDQ